MENFYFYLLFFVPFLIGIIETISFVFITLRIEEGVKKHIRYQKEVKGFIFEKKVLERREKNNWKESFSYLGLSILKDEGLNFVYNLFSISLVISAATFMFLNIKFFDYLLAASIVLLFFKNLLSNQAEIKFNSLKKEEEKPQLKVVNLKKIA